jgi:SAM-dependent methyltransferase
MAGYPTGVPGLIPSSSEVSARWSRDHPWAAVYTFFMEREALSYPAGRLFFGTDTRLLTRALDAIRDVPEGGAALDIPCGGGVALRGLEGAGSVRFVAADISPAMLDRTESVARARGLPNVETRLADVEAMPFEDGEFDLVLSFAGLHCFPNPEVAVHEIARVTKPGGRFTGSFFANDSGARYALARAGGRAMGLLGPSATFGEVERWLDEAGFGDGHVEQSGALGYFTARRR